MTITIIIIIIINNKNNDNNNNDNNNNNNNNIKRWRSVFLKTVGNYMRPNDIDTNFGTFLSKQRALAPLTAWYILHSLVPILSQLQCDMLTQALPRYVPMPSLCRPIQLYNFSQETITLFVLISSLLRVIINRCKVLPPQAETLCPSPSGALPLQPLFRGASACRHPLTHAATRVGGMGCSRVLPSCGVRVMGPLL